MPALCACGHGYTFSFAQGRVFCRACESRGPMTDNEVDRAYLARERKRRADPDCISCDGEGVITYTASNRHGETESPCACLFEAGDFSAPDPLADEGQSDARELARER